MVGFDSYSIRSEEGVYVLEVFVRLYEARRVTRVHD